MANPTQSQGIKSSLAGMTPITRVLSVHATHASGYVTLRLDGKPQGSMDAKLIRLILENADEVEEALDMIQEDVDAAKQRGDALKHVISAMGIKKTDPRFASKRAELIAAYKLKTTPAKQAAPVDNEMATMWANLAQGLAK